MLLTDWLMNLAPARRTRRTHRSDQRRFRHPAANLAQIEKLEDRTLLTTFFVDNAADFVITNDQGAPGLDDGDEVTWDTASTHPSGPVAGLIFGTNAFASIQDAIDVAAASGDTINVAAGTFAEDLVITKSIILAGANVGTAGDDVGRGLESIIDPSSSFGIEVQADDVTIDGFEITGLTRDGINVRPTNSAPGVSTRSNITIQNNFIHEVLVSGNQVNGIVFGEKVGGGPDSTDNATISNVTIANNLIDVTDDNTARGIVMTGQFATILFDNFDITDNVIQAKNNGLFISENPATFTADGIEILNNRFETPGSLGINAGNLDGTSKVNGNTFINNASGAALNFRQPGGEVIGNTFENHTNVGLFFFDDTFFPQSSEDATVTGNVFTNNFRQVGAPALAVDLDAIQNNNTFDGGVRVSSNRNLYESIQDAIDAAMPGDTVTVVITTPTYVENIDVNQAVTLAGEPTIDGTLTASVAGATLAAGTSPGTMTSGDLTLTSGSILDVEVDGVTTAGTDYDQYVVNGTVDLGGATLQTSGMVSGVMVGDTLVIIDNDDVDAVTGTFDGLANGAFVTINGEQFRIFYNGGDGNDVVLEGAPALTVVYVDDDFAGTTPGDDPDGAGPATSFGVDSFATIQEGVDAVAAGGTVIVNAGTYSGLNVIDKSVTLSGANAGVHPAVGVNTTETVGTRAAESIIQHNGFFAFQPQATDITIDGFRFQGTGSRVIDDQGFDIDNLHITNNIFTNTGTPGGSGVVQFQGGDTSDLKVDFNLFQTTGSAPAILLGGATGGGANYDGLRIANNLFNQEGNALFQGTDIVLVNAVIEQNEFDGTIGGTSGIGRGINVGKGGNISIRDNYFHDLFFTAFQVGIVNGEVLRNEFEQITAFPGFFGQAFELWGGQFTTTVSDTVLIANNIIHFNDVSGASIPTHGLRLRAPDGIGIDASTITLFENTFINGGVRTDARATRHQGDQTTALNASGNFWSTVDPNEILALTEGPTDFTYFLEFGVDQDGMAPGFQGDFSELNVTALGFQTGPAGRIQEALDAVDAGGTVNVLAGVYIETVNGTAGTVNFEANADANIDGMITADISGVSTSTITAIGNLTLGDASSNAGFSTTGTLNVGGNTVTLLDMNVATLGVSTTLGGGTLIADQGLSLSAGDVISGNGTIDVGTGSSDLITNTGTISPGTGGSAATILVDGDLDAESGTYEVDVTTTNGVSDLLDVDGAVDVTGATLNVSAMTSPAIGNQYTIIDNDGADAIVGMFIGLDEGEVFQAGADTYQITYIGGDGNDVVLTVLDGNNPLIEGTANDDIFEVEQIGTNTLQVILNGNVIYTGDPLGSLTLEGLAGNDTAIFNYSANDFKVPITFNGGTETTGDDIVLNGSTTFTNATFNFDSESAGNIVIDGNATVFYTDLEPISSTIDVMNVVLNYTNMAAENVTLIENGDDTLTADSNAAEITTFAKPTNSLTINTGTNDTVTFQGSNTIELVNADLNVDAGTIVVNQNVTTAGDAVLTARTGNITDNADDGMANLTAGKITLEALGNGNNIGVSSADRFELNATLLEINNTGANHDYYILDAGGGLQVTDSSTGGGGSSVFDLLVENGNLIGVPGGPGDVRADIVIVEVTGSGQIGAASNTALEINANTRFDATSAGGNIYARDVTADLPVGLVDAGTGHVELTAPNGSITDAGTDANDVNAASAILLAANAVGSGMNFLETTVSQLEGRSGGTVTTGGFWVENTGDLEVGNITNGQGPATIGVSSRGGDISIYVESGNLLVSEVIDSNRTGTTNGGDIELETGVPMPMGGDITIDSTILSGNGLISIQADNDVELTANAVIDSEMGSNVTIANLFDIPQIEIIADADIDDFGEVIMADGSVVDAWGGDITVIASEDISVSLLRSTSLIFVSANLGAVVDSDMGTDLDVDDHGSGTLRAILFGPTGIGSLADPIETAAAELQALASTGDVFVDNTGNVVLTDISGTLGFPIGLSVDAGGEAGITTTGSLTVAEDVQAFDDVSLTTVDSAAGGEDLTVNTMVDVVSTTGNITLQAGDDVSLADSSDVIATAGTITINGDFGNADAAGTTISLLGTLDSNDSVGGVMVNGDANDDTIILNPGMMHLADSASLDGGAGNDLYHIWFGRLTGGADAVSVVEAGPAMANNDRVILEGRDVDETFNVLGQDGGTVQAIGVMPATDEIVTYSPGVEQLSIFANGGVDGDILNVEPSQTATIFVDGGSPGFGPGPDDVPARTGDTLNFDSLGNTFAIQGKTILTDGGMPMPFKGVTFFGIENLPLDPIGSDVGKFDFDKTSNGSIAITQAGYTSVPQNKLYVETDPVGTRFGWLSMPGELNDFDLGAGTTANFDDAFRDGHKGNGPNTFRADVATNGWYLVSAKLGDGTALDDIQIRNGDTGQILIEEIDSLAGESVAVTFAVLVEDNTLDITFDDLGGLAFFSVNALEFRPGELLTFGSPDPAIQVVPNSPTDPIDAVNVGDGNEPFLADGRSVRYFNGYNATANSVVTVSAAIDSDANGLDGLPDLDVTVLAALDIDPDVAGVQVQADANGEFQYAIISPAGRGTVFIKMEELSGDQTGCVAVDFISPTDRLFDFNSTLASPTQIPAATPTNGAAGDPANDAYHGVLPTQVFAPGTGYGWVGGVGIGGYDRGPQAESVQGELRQDAHFSNVDQVFRVELAPGTYTVNVTIGDSANARPNVEVSANGVVVLPDLDAGFGEFVTGTFEVTIGPAGVLDLNFGLSAPASFWVVNGIEIRSMQEGIVNTNVVRGNGNDQADGTTIDQITGQTATPPADGEMYLTVTTDLGELVNDASAAYAGHQVFVDAAGNFTIDIRRPASDMDVTATVNVLAVDGSVADSTTIDFTAFAGAPPRRFDFNQGASGLTATDFTAVAHNNLYNGDFGWQATVSPFDFYAANSATPLLRRDGARGSAPGTFQVSADIGTNYDLRVYVGSRFVPTQVQVSVEGGAFVAVSPAVGANNFTTVTLLGISDQNADGRIDIALSGVGGSWWVNGLDIAESAGGLPPSAPLSFAGDGGNGAATLSAVALESIINAAIIRLAAAGEDVSGLTDIEFQITDLDDQGALGLAGSKVILIDDDGFGHGWFVDMTPLIDEEFTFVAGAELSANGSDASGRVDLLTVVMHELGHILGYGDLDAAITPHELMTGQIGLGTRRLPSSVGNTDSTSNDSGSDVSDNEPTTTSSVSLLPSSTTTDEVDDVENALVDDESWTVSDSTEIAPAEPEASTAELRDSVFEAFLETAKTKTPWDLFETTSL